MKFKIHFFTVILLFAVAQSGCESNKTPENDSEAANETKNAIVTGNPAIPETGSLNGDTINMHGKFVLFYGPAALHDANTPESVEISTFRTTSSEILDSLTTIQGLYAGYTSANNIRIYSSSNGKPMIILRSSFTEPVGMIISDGLQSPMIKKGFAPATDYKELLQKYFIRPS